MKEKKILFKLENDERTVEIENINKEELLVFICKMLESLIQTNIVTHDVMLTAINLYLTIGATTDLDDIKNKQLRNLIDELSKSMLMLFKGLDEATNNK